MNKNSILYSLLTLYDIEELRKENIVSYFVGTTNPLLMNYGKIDFDCIINLDEDKITINNKKINSNILAPGKKDESLMEKLKKEFKFIFEDENLDDLSDTWMLDKDNNTKNKKKVKRKKSIYLQDINKNSSFFEGSDDHIRKIFKKYITGFLADICLVQYITNNKNYSNDIKLSKIKDVLNDYNCEFIFNWITKTNNFLFWNHEHDSNLWRLSPHLKKCKNAKKIYENGDIYEGELSFGEPNNNGKLEYSAEGIQFIYIGEFHKGLKHGKGNLSSKTNNKFNYDGDWVKDKFEGYGTLFNFGEKYIGNFKRGKKWGEGTLYKNNGDIVEGEFEEGNITKGKIIFKNDDEYEGGFEKGKMKGKGKYKYKNGDLYEGYFENDLFNGEGILTKANGEVNKGIFKDGILIESMDDLDLENNIKIDDEIKNKEIENDKNKDKNEIKEELKKEKESFYNELANNINKNISFDDSIDIGTSAVNITMESIY